MVFLRNDQYTVLPSQSNQPHKYTVVATAPPPCPKCGQTMSRYGNRARRLISLCNGMLTQERYLLTRWQCKPCRNVHHERIDGMRPYCHYSTRLLEQAAAQSIDLLWTEIDLRTLAAIGLW